ncbi:hypothetical protein [Neobacillus sp. D3-1R]|uniref:hypothetical protein n=1 Tax=Neobacillus sp. D3-1R TaxID=3445778 RepID=UPI003F9F8511
MKQKRTYMLIILIVLGAIAYALYYFNVVNVPQVRFFSEDNIYQLNIEEDWEKFKEELEINSGTSDDARIEDFNVYLTKDGDIEEVRFNLAMQKENKYTIYQYNSCRSCQDEKKVIITKKTVNDWFQYPGLMNANEFFKRLQILNQQKVFIRDEKDVKLRSSGWKEGIGLPGEYYLLEENHLRKLSPPSDQLSYEGFNLLLIEIISGELTDENTRTIFISQFVKNKE